MDRRSWILASIAAFLFLVTSVLVVRSLVGGGGDRDARSRGEKVYFFDLSADELFAAPSDSLPPMKGTDGPEEDAYRAVVIACEDCESERQIAYLQMYTPELIRRFRSEKFKPPMGDPFTMDNTLVRRPDSPDWVPMSSPEGLGLISGWPIDCPGRAGPKLCLP